jgi:hypothetical protein
MHTIMNLKHIISEENEKFFQKDDGKNSSGWYEVIRSEVVSVFPNGVEPHDSNQILLSLCKFLDSQREWEATIMHTKPRKQWRILRCPVVVGIANRIVSTDWSRTSRMCVSSSWAKQRFDHLVAEPGRMLNSRWLSVTLVPR